MPTLPPQSHLSEGCTASQDRRVGAVAVWAARPIVQFRIARLILKWCFKRIQAWFPPLILHWCFKGIG